MDIGSMLSIYCTVWSYVSPCVEQIFPFNQPPSCLSWSHILATSFLRNCIRWDQWRQSCVIPLSLDVERVDDSWGNPGYRVEASDISPFLPLIQHSEVTFVWFHWRSWTTWAPAVLQMWLITVAFSFISTSLSPNHISCGMDSLSKTTPAFQPVLGLIFWEESYLR